MLCYFAELMQSKLLLAYLYLKYIQLHSYKADSINRIDFKVKGG
jgi:hypothetical protein